jgi:hypothetical protein
MQRRRVLAALAASGALFALSLNSRGAFAHAGGHHREATHEHHDDHSHDDSDADSHYHHDHGDDGDHHHDCEDRGEDTRDHMECKNHDGEME